MGKTILSYISSWISAICAVVLVLLALGIIKKCNPKDSKTPPPNQEQIKTPSMDSSDYYKDENIITKKEIIKPTKPKQKPANTAEEIKTKAKPNNGTFNKSKDEDITANVEDNNTKNSFFLILNSVLAP